MKIYGPGSHVVYQCGDGREILGEIAGSRWLEDELVRVYVVRYFNNEDWPIQPRLVDPKLRVLERTYEDAD